MRKRFMLIIGALALIFGTACTPHEALWMTFGPGGGGTVDLYEQAEKVAWCESRLNPGAVSPTNDSGLMQINIVHRSNFERVTGQSWAARFDPYWNAYYGRWLYNHEGWSPWACRRVL